MLKDEFASLLGFDHEDEEEEMMMMNAITTSNTGNPSGTALPNSSGNGGNGNNDT